MLIKFIYDYLLVITLSIILKLIHSPIPIYPYVPISFYVFLFYLTCCTNFSLLSPDPPCTLLSSYPLPPFFFPYFLHYNLSHYSPMLVMVLPL